MTKVSKIQLKGKIIGFEDYADYILEDAFGETSPFRILMCNDASISFIIANPFQILDDYSFRIEDDLVNDLGLNGLEDVAVLCVVRYENRTFYINLRSPLIINTARGVFIQTILQDEAYGVSVPFEMKKNEV